MTFAKLALATPKQSVYRLLLHPTSYITYIYTTYYHRVGYGTNSFPYGDLSGDRLDSALAPLFFLGSLTLLGIIDIEEHIDTKYDRLE